jgi:hypothetical protein
MRIEIDMSERWITVNGVTIAVEVLEMLTRPDRGKFYRFQRSGSVVILSAYSTAVEAEADLRAVERAASMEDVCRT